MAAPEVIRVDTDYEDPMKFESLCMECMNNVRSQPSQLLLFVTSLASYWAL